MGQERPKQFLLNLYLRGLQKDIARQVAISQPVTLSSAIQWAEHVDVATRTYGGAGSSNKQSSNSGNNRGGRGRGIGWRGGRSGRGTGGRQQGQQQQKKPPNTTFNQSKTHTPVCQICGKIGHTADKCWRISSQIGGNSSGRGQSQPRVETEVRADQAVVHEEDEEEGSPQWL